VTRLLLVVAIAIVSGTISVKTGFRVDSTSLPTGQRIEPSGKTLIFYGRPLALAISHTGTIAVKYSHGILFVDGRTHAILDDLRLKRGPYGYPVNLGGNGMTGIAWDASGRTVWSADGFGLLLSATLGAGGHFAWDPSVDLPGPSGRVTNPKTHESDPSVPASVVLSLDGKTAYIALSRMNAIAAVDITERKVAYTIPTGGTPFALLIARDTLYVANLAGSPPTGGDASADAGGTPILVDPKTGIASSGTVSVIDLATRRKLNDIRVGLAPSGLQLSMDGSYIYVANANDDSISLINVRTNVVDRTISLPLQDGFGAAPNGLAISPITGALYIAEGGDNRILILDPKTMRATGQVSTAWYPDAIAFEANGTLLTTSLKGWGGRGHDFGFPRHDLGFRLFVPLSDEGYNVYDYAGVLQAIPPRPAAGTPPTRSSTSFLPISSTSDPKYAALHAVPVPLRENQHSVFKHVVFIIKENHTYDDYFGDERAGNSDPTLCAFSRRITPNHHALADRFGLFDNFYVNGTMSADGHQWTNEADANDYVERNTASWARTYPSDGTDPLAYSRNGFIWQRVLERGLTFRDYGEFTMSAPIIIPPSATWIEFWTKRLRGGGSASFRNVVDIAPLRPYVDMRYPGFTLRISDQARADEFERELRQYQHRGRLPAFVLMQLGNDHTAGESPGYPVPNAAVADNDLALGRVIDAISHSQFWKNTVIFVVEDDAQNGLDHVDGHRTMALVISAYNRKHVVDSTFYNQTSILATLERILRLRPLTQFDALSQPIVSPFGTIADLTPYVALPTQVSLDSLNPRRQGSPVANLPRDGAWLEKRLRRSRNGEPGLP
jgi:YVTN family beta-propeller protein